MALPVALPTVLLPALFAIFFGHREDSFDVRERFLSRRMREHVN